MWQALNDFWQRLLDPAGPSVADLRRWRRERTEFEAMVCAEADRAMALHAAGRLAEVDALLGSGAPAEDDSGVSNLTLAVYEELARRLARAGDRAAGREYGDRVLRFHDDHRQRECGGAGGHAANAALEAARRRLAIVYQDDDAAAKIKATR